MKLFCPLSGTSYTVDIGYGHGQAPHPIFYIPLKSLIYQHLDKYCDGSLSSQEVHLFGCALLHKLPIIWESPLDFMQSSTQLHETWRKNIEKLATICLKYTHIEDSSLPQYRIDKRNRDLNNLKIYLASIDEAVAELSYDEDDPEYLTHPVPTYIQQNAEEVILKMLRGSMSKVEKKESFPRLMADWAATTGNFPTTEIVVAITKGEEEVTTIRKHWKNIVYLTFKATDPIDLLSSQVTPGDMEELIEHCEVNIEIGTIHSLALLRKLREVKSILKEFKSPAPSASMTIAKSYVITADFLSGELLGGENETKFTVDRPKVTIPEKEPLRRDYPNTAAYLRARIAWNKGY